MKSKFIILIVLISGFIFSSCSTEVDINADYKEIPIVFCILDPSEEYQYVKVNKAFLGKMNVTDMAQISDSLFFKDSVLITLKKFQGAVERRSWTFDYCDTVQKARGFFGNSKNILYMKKIEFGTCDANTSFVLNIDIGNGKHRLKSEVKLVSEMGIFQPAENVPHISIVSKNGFNFKYYAGNSACIFESHFRFNYLEVTGRDTVKKSLIYKFFDKIFAATDKNDLRDGKLDVPSFYQYVASNLPQVEGRKYLADMPNSCELIIMSAEENYYIYTQVTSPSTGIIQFRPDYTNIISEIEGNKCLGLFASRNSYRRAYKFSIATLDSLYRGMYTEKLGFASPYDPYYLPFFLEEPIE
jgi:hypothetical protein